jgi:hypothetical protein
MMPASNQIENILSSRKGYFLIFLAWLLAEMAWCNIFGVEFSLESVKYINEANYLLQHHSLSQARYLFYLPTILVITFSFVIKTGLYGALFFLLIYNFLTYYVFFQALKKRFTVIQSFAIFLFCLAFWPYQSWTLSLYSETFFYSSIVLLLSHLLAFKKFTLKYSVLLCLTVALVVISRPLGILCVPGVLAFIFFKLNRKQKIVFSFTVVMFGLLLNYVARIIFTTTPDWTMQRPLLEAFLICDIPGPLAGKPLDLTDDPNPLYQLFYYITHNFSIFISLAAERMKLFFFLTRDYYSTKHNTFLLAVVIPLYIIIVAGVRKIRKRREGIVPFLLVTILCFAASVAVQCDDYHNRFFLSLWPLLLLLVAFAVFRKRSVANG